MLIPSSRLLKVFWMLRVAPMPTCCFATGSATCWCLKPCRMDVPMARSGAISRSPGASMLEQLSYRVDILHHPESYCNIFHESVKFSVSGFMFAGV